MKTSSLKQQAWKHWMRQIDRLLSQHSFDWATTTLKGIRDNVEHSQSITPNQIQAIKNIQNGLYDGKNEYETYRKILTS